MSTNSVAINLSCTLYYKRGFPLYCFNTVVGLNNKGKGIVYSYDAVGSYTGLGYNADGSTSELINPILIGALGYCNNRLVPPQPV